MNNKYFLKLYTVDDAYIQDLQNNLDEHVFSNIDPKYVHSRKYLGVLLQINGLSYYAPFSSPKESDYMLLNGNKVIRNSIIPIIRMTETDENGNRYLLGTIKLSNMIPVPDDKVRIYDLDNEADKEYKDLVLKEKRFINRNEEMIVAYAERLYREKNDGKVQKGYLANTFEFIKFENYIRSKL